jgi:Domain of unknown function (DUF5916)/Carbohydrate family 9 binding domain-like
MRMFCIALLVVCLAVPAIAQETAAPKRTLAIARIDKAINVDGIIDLSEWSGAQPVELPFETFPGDNISARVKTEALLAYDDKALYVGIRAYDPNPRSIRAHLTDRDSAYQDDFAGVAIDTFNDERRAFEFFVNPHGVQMDLTQDDIARVEDDSWDAIWSSAGKIHADRWEVEMAIPFSQLRFKSADVQTWGIDIVRIYPRDQRYRLGLHAQNRNRACYVCQMSKLTGFRGISPGRNIEVSPTVTSQRTDARPDLGSPLANGSFNTEPGVTARWGITPNYTLNGAINPDFSQVEADSVQLDINAQFALFFNEKRPFFLEGADFFQTPFTAVYTRTIAEPDWGAKLTGKEGKHGGGLYVAQDARTEIVIPGPQGSAFTSLSEKNLAAVARYRHDVGQRSNVGVLFTTRNGGGYSNRVAGIDANYRVTESDTIKAQFLTSRTAYPGEIAERFEMSDSMNDRAFRFDYRHNTRNWFWKAIYTDIGREFRADSGFMPQVGYNRPELGFERVWWREKESKSPISRVFVGGDWDKATEEDGPVLEEEFEMWVGLGGPKQSFFIADFGVRTERNFNGMRFDNDPFVSLFGEMTPNGRVYFNVDTGWSQHIDFANTRPAELLRFAPFVRWRATKHLNLELGNRYERLDVDGGRLFDANISEFRAVYQFNVRMFVRALIQYTDIQRDPSLYTFDVSERTRRLFPQLLFSYKVNPQTVVFVGYSSTRNGNESIDLTEQNRTLFVKLGYAWAM